MDGRILVLLYYHPSVQKIVASISFKGLNGPFFRHQTPADLPGHFAVNFWRCKMRSRILKIQLGSRKTVLARIEMRSIQFLQRTFRWSYYFSGSFKAFGKQHERPSYSPYFTSCGFFMGGEVPERQDLHFRRDGTEHLCYMRQLLSCELTGDSATFVVPQNKSIENIAIYFYFLTTCLYSLY